jgi:hypothetical protein
MSKLLTELDAVCITDKVWKLDVTLIYESDLVGRIEVPAGFETDFASVPRVPIFYTLFGDRAHRESVLHDWLYRYDSVPLVTRSQADGVFKEAMQTTGKPWKIYFWMWLGVRIGSTPYWHKKSVADRG